MSNQMKKLLIGGSLGLILVILLLFFFGIFSVEGFFGIDFFRNIGTKPELAMMEMEQEEYQEEPTSTLTEVPGEVPTEVIISKPTLEPEPTVTITPEPISTEETRETGPFGPDSKDFPEGVNMLTGKYVKDPETLNFLPALVSITNWPITARPQAGIGSASLIYEIYIGQGMSRFLTLFYGEFPGGSQEGNDGGDDLAIENSGADSIGPIRSGRLPYESIRKINNGFLVMASAFAGVSQNLDKVTNVFGSDPDNINSAMMPAGQLQEIAAQYEGGLVSGSLSGNLFDATPPQGGVPGETFWFIYNIQNQIAWRYDEMTGSYYRYADQADGKTFVKLADRLDNQVVDVSNVVLLYVNHRYCTEKAFDVDLLSIGAMPAVIFRDGKKYDVNWTTRNGEFEVETGALRPIRFIDENGDPFALKPGPTWFILVPNLTPIWEAPLFEDVPTDLDVWVPEEPDKLIYRLLNMKEPGTGVWVSRFYQSLMIYDQNVCSQIQ